MTPSTKRKIARAYLCVLFGALALACYVGVWVASWAFGLVVTVWLSAFVAATYADAGEP